MNRLLPLAALCVLAVGCANLTLERPSASVRGMKLANIDAQGFTMDFDVAIDNPNEIALPLDVAEYKLALADTTIAEGKLNPDTTVPARGSSRVRVPLTLTYDNLLAAQRAIVRGGGNVSYALDAGLSFKTGRSLLGDLRVPLKHKGTLPLRDVLQNPEALLRNPAARKLATQMLGGLFGP